MGGAHVTDGDEGGSGEAVLVALRRIIRAIDIHSKQLVRRHGMTGPQLVVLREIVRCGGASVGELARVARLSSATVTGIVTRLETRALVERRRSDEDRRRVLVRPTAQAARVLEHAPAPLQEKFLREFSSLHDWEQALLVAALQRVAAMMDAEGLDVEPLLTVEPLADELPDGGD